MPTKVTTPLAKAITTLEGQLVIAADVVIGAAATISPDAVSPKVAAIVVVVQHVALLVQRAVIKVQASKVINAVLASPAPLAAVESVVEKDLAPPAPQGPPVGAPESAVAPDPVA